MGAIPKNQTFRFLNACNSLWVPKIGPNFHKKHAESLSTVSLYFSSIYILFKFIAIIIIHVSV